MEKLKKLGVLIGTVVLAVGLGTGCSAQAKKNRHLAKAEKYFAAGELEKAKIEYMGVQQYDRTNAIAWAQIGRIYLRQGSPLQALTYLMPARQLDPNNPAVRSALGELFLIDGQPLLAREELLATLEKDPTNTTAILLLPSTALNPVDVGMLEVRLQNLEKQTGDSPALQLARAGLLARQQKFAQAEQLVQQALKLNPKMPEAHVEMFRFHMSRTNLAAAEQAFKTAADLAPIRSPIRVNYANFKNSRGGREEAIAVLKNITSEAPDYLPAQEALASFAFEDRKYDEALALTDRIIAQDSVRLETYKLRSLIHAAMRAPEKAVQEWEQLEGRLTKFPGTRQLTRMELARAHVNARNPENALGLLDQVISSSSNRLDRLSIEANLLRASLLLGQNRGDEVVSSMGLLLQRTNIFQARLLLADGYRQLGRSADALNVLTRLANENPGDAQLAYTLGLLLREQKRPADARKVFQRSRELNPPNLPALSQLVELEIAEKNFPAAFKLVKEEQAKTNSAPLKFLEGTIYEGQKQAKEAEAAYMQALEMDPYFSNSYFALANLHNENKRQAEAIKDLEALLEKKKDDVRALMLAAMLSAEIGQYDKAKDLYERLIEVSPRFAAPYNNLAYILADKLGKVDAGLELAKKARTLDPNEPGIADTLGWILYLKEDYQQALPLVRTAAAAHPNDPEIQYHFGMTSYMVGQTDQAKAALEKAVAGKPFPGKEEAEKRLALLKGGAAGGADIPALEAALKSQPKDVSTRTRLAGMYETAGQPKKAAEHYEELLKLNPRSSAAALRLAQLYAGPLKDGERALPAAQKAYDLARDNAEANGLLGHLLYGKGDFARAHALLHVATRNLSGRPELLYEYGWTAYYMGRLADAEQAMRQVLSAKPDFAEAGAAKRFLELNTLYFQPQGLAAAEPAIQATLKADPNHVPALMAQAALHRQRGKANLAVPTYENILQKFPSFAPATRELALVLATDPANQEKALKLAMKARESFPDDMELTRVLGMLSFQKKDYTYARTLLERAATAKPNDAEIFFRLGLTHLQLRDKPRGKQALERALALNLQGESQKLAKEELAKLQ